ncbi:unnamed protein product [Sphagnum tenellum]
MATVCLTWQLKIHARTPLQGVITVPQNSVPLCREFEGRGSPLSSHLAILPQKQSQNFHVTVARFISWTKSSNFPALKKTLDRGTTLDILYDQVPIKDGCPPDLRKNLPRAVGVLDYLIKDDRKVYLHCTAGVGRSPSVAVAYYYWIKGMTLNAAYAFVKSRRLVSHPNTGAIQNATDDVLQRANFQDNLTGEDRDKIKAHVLGLV